MKLVWYGLEGVTFFLDGVEFFILTQLPLTYTADYFSPISYSSELQTASQALEYKQNMSNIIQYTHKKNESS